MVTELSGSNFDSFVKEHSVALVDCWAPWCGPCRRMGPIIDELAADLEGKVGVAKLNTDDNQDLAYKFGISAIPTLLIFRDGNLADSLVGLRPKEAIIDALGLGDSIRILGLVKDDSHSTSALMDTDGELFDIDRIA